MKRLIAIAALIACCPVVATLQAADALAQGLSPSPGRLGGTPPPKPDTPAGPAEAAPEEEREEEPEIPRRPEWPGVERARIQHFQLRGYFRFRSNLFHKLNLGMRDDGGLAAPFYGPISEHPSSTLRCEDRVNIGVPGGGERDLSADDCPAETLHGANIRLRLEPTINVTERVRVNAQLDIFDNLMLGSTPRGISGNQRSAEVPISAFTEGQAPPVAGRNIYTPAIVVKRAWAEVGTPFGQIRFGRMPVHWGLGLFANDGSCWDCDFGDTADRIMFVTELAGHTFGMGYDFTSSGPSSLTVDTGQRYYFGQPIDLETLDDVRELFWVVGRIDPDEVVRDRVDRGELVLNYGLYLVWRKQDFDYDTTAAGVGPGLDSTVGEYAQAFLERHYWTLMPDIWLRLMWRKLVFEAEAVLIGGRIGNAGNAGQEATLGILQLGWVARSHYKLLKDSLTVGLEVGMASGDQAEQADNEINRRRLNSLAATLATPGDTWLREFRFDYDYHVDLILFRQLLGTVSNAIYFKPWVQYELVESFGARLDLIYSLAHQPVAFPGNARNLGVELDLDIFYQNIDDGFYAGVRYGVLFPLGALDRPADIFGSARAFDAEVAHTLQARLIVKF